MIGGSAAAVSDSFADIDESAAAVLVVLAMELLAIGSAFVELFTELAYGFWLSPRSRRIAVFSSVLVDEISRQMLAIL